MNDKPTGDDKPVGETESLIEFPCDFTIKVVGRTSDEFEAAVLTIIHKHAPSLSDRVIVSRTSSGQKYLSLSITIHAESKSQLDRIYQDLSSSPHVLMAL